MPDSTYNTKHETKVFRPLRAIRRPGSTKHNRSLSSIIQLTICLILLAIRVSAQVTTYPYHQSWDGDLGGWTHDGGHPWESVSSITQGHPFQSDYGPVDGTHFLTRPVRRWTDWRHEGSIKSPVFKIQNAIEGEASFKYKMPKRLYSETQQDQH